LSEHDVIMVGVAMPNGIAAPNRAEFVKKSRLFILILFQIITNFLYVPYN